MHLHREGRTTILLGIIILAIAAFTAYLLPIHLLFKALIILPFLGIFILILWFFRLPERKSTLNKTQVIAPADGKIVVIEKTTEEEYFKDERIQVSIFMSPLNVHQNVYPIPGTVSYTRYHKGKYLVAWHPKSSTLNERSTVVVKHENGTEILMRQIAGAVARRICTYSKAGDNASQCGEMGFIKFGSRVDLFLPLSARIICQVGDVSKGKQTIIAEI
jgi:phosphatidylserine decarboxylase